MKKQLSNEFKRMQVLAGIIIENTINENNEIIDNTKMYDEAINYAHEITPEIMYEDGELGDAESLLQAEDEFEYLLRGDEINPSSTLAYQRYWSTALDYLKSKITDVDVEDFKQWFIDTASYEGYQESLDSILKNNFKK